MELGPVAQRTQSPGDTSTERLEKQSAHREARSTRAREQESQRNNNNNNREKWRLTIVVAVQGRLNLRDRCQERYQKQTAAYSRFDHTRVIVQIVIVLGGIAGRGDGRLSSPRACLLLLLAVLWPSVRTSSCLVVLAYCFLSLDTVGLRLLFSVLSKSSRRSFLSLSHSIDSLPSPFRSLVLVLSVLARSRARV